MYQKAYTLLRKLKVDTNLNEYEVTSKSSGWLAPYDEAANRYIVDEENRLTETYNAILLVAEELKAEAKAESAEGCVATLDQDLDTVRNYAGQYQACVMMVGNAVVRYLAELNNQIYMLSQKILDYQQRFNVCGKDEGCLEELIPVLQNAFAEIPEAILKKIPEAEAYIAESSGFRLQYCSGCAQLRTETEALFEQVKECIQTQSDIILYEYEEDYVDF